jgi:Nudix hydrolase domain
MHQLWHISWPQEWQQTGRKGIWLKVPITHAQLVPVATQHGFYFHHAEPEYVMLARWLPDTENKLPCNASHQVRRACAPGSPAASFSTYWHPVYRGGEPAM